MIDPWLGIGMVLASLGALLAALSPLSHRHPELARKAVHVGMGVATLAFPWLFREAWPVLLLAGVTMIAFVALRLVGPQNFAIGRTLHTVSRSSHGEVHFVLGTCIVFVLAAGNAPMFCLPMLVLTFADTAAALVGQRVGRWRYAGDKTAEGSAACFAVASCCIGAPLALLTHLPVAELVAITLLVAAIATAMEAAGPRGLDNLLIPLGTFLALESGGIAPMLLAPARFELAAAVAVVAASAMAALLAILGLLDLSRAHPRFSEPR